MNNETKPEWWEIEFEKLALYDDAQLTDPDEENHKIIKSFISKAISKAKEDERGEVVQEAIATVVNNSIPSNEQMKIVRELRTLTKTDSIKS
jgi:hypothetical protein